jgi:hypothetical protein
MKTSNHWTILLCLFPIIGTFGQTITTYDSRKSIEPIVSNYTAVDLAITDVQANPSYAPYLRTLAAPAMFDQRTRIGITITGTVAQAEAQLNAAISNQYPASVRFANKDRKAEAADAASKSAAANSVPALRAEVKRLAELVESLLEDEELP